MMDKLTRLTFDVDSDDERDINAAIARYQRYNRWEDTGETLVPEGDGPLCGLILAEICRAYLEGCTDE